MWIRQAPAAQPPRETTTRVRLEVAQSRVKAGLLTLDENAQQLIVSSTKKHQSADGRDLFAPDFRKLAPAET